MTLHIIPILKDNYTYLIERNGKAMVIDPGEAEPVLEHLRQLNTPLNVIVNTHHHGDHTAGNRVLQAEYDCDILKPDAPLKEGVPIDWQGLHFDIYHAPGHTLDHMILVERTENWLFCGDVLFQLGCGRVFEGTHAQMFQSLQKIYALPDDLRVYCGHDYARGNARFALILGENKMANDILAQPTEARIGIGHTLGEEKQFNPFLRCKTVEEFSKVRTLKDHF